MNGNTWIRPALVVTQRSKSVYLHTHGDLKKIVARRVKPFELVNTDEYTHNTKEVMQEDGLEDVENLYTAQLNEYYYTKKHNNKVHTDSTTGKHNATTRNNAHTINYTEKHNTKKHNATARNNIHNNTHTDPNTEKYDEIARKNTHDNNYAEKLLNTMPLQEKIHTTLNTLKKMLYTTKSTLKI